MKIANSLVQRLGSIQLDEGKLATIFINPPLVAQLSGEFIKLSKRNIESSDISAVIENMSGGIPSTVTAVRFELGTRTRIA
jgi:hypothetical protein